VHSKLVQSLLAAVGVTALASAGCSARRPAAGPPFRLGAVYGRPVLFSPSIPESSPNGSAINLEINAPASRASASKNCLAESGLFRAEIEKTYPDTIQIALPSPERWIGDVHAVFDPDGDAVVSLYKVLAKLEQEGKDGCFADTGSMIRNFILQSLPMEPNDSLFSYYGYRSSRSGLDLKPGIRLKVERAYLKPPETGEQVPSSKNQEGVSFVYFHVESASDGKVRFRRASDVRFNPASLRKKFQNTALESELSSLPPESAYRLVFYGLHIPTEQKLSASIIGAGITSELDEFERELRLRPTEGCKSFAGTRGITCVDFTGWVTVTPQISVELNGKTTFIDCGTPIKDVLLEGALSSLTIQRKFMNSYRNIRFKSGDANVLSLVLVGGDRLTWSKTVSSNR
jgi:hypothetical protein